MDFGDKVRYVKNAQYENKLVIFVGAGVSKNSNLPDWENLLREFIDKLNYPLSKGENISNDEYLKIPQYFYNIYGKEKYKSVVKEALDIVCKPNDIHKLIFQLNPKHIITTNYDRLIEETKIEQKMLFDVICNDKDLLDSKKSKYIIKMHGDIKDLDNIVLKENDYLNYSQSHILIETFIKSLLVSNTFLFIGYSLNDYNLKQIMSWVDYLAKGYTDISDRPKSFIIQEVNEKYKEFIEDYYEKNNIFIINPKEIENDYFYDIKTELKDEYGQRLYGTLMYINDYPNNIIDKLYYGSERFKKLDRIAIWDVFHIYRFKYCEVLCENTLFFPLIDEREFLVVKNIINEIGVKEKEVKKMLINAGIRFIQIDNNGTCEQYNLLVNNNEILDYVDELYELELKCNYLEIKERIDFIENKEIETYFLFILQDFERVNEYLNEKNDILDKDIYNLLRHKLNLGLFKQYISRNGEEYYNEFRYIHRSLVKENMYEIGYLKSIIDGNKEEYLELVSLKEKHMKKYLKSTNTIYYGNIDRELYLMMTIVYNYYFYIKRNRIYLNYFDNMENFFEPFIEAILCTYSPKTNRKIIVNGFEDINNYNSYVFKLIDFDIIIKYSDYKKVKEFIRKYQVNEILYDDKFSIVEILGNLCEYMKVISNKINVSYLKKMILLLTTMSLNEKDINNIIRIIEDLLIDNENKLDIYIFIEIGNDFIEFINKNNMVIAKNSLERVIRQLFNEDVDKHLNEYRKIKIKYKFLKSVETFSGNIYQEYLNNIIEEENFNAILGLITLLSEDQISIVKSKINNNVDKIDIEILIRYIINNLIDYTEFIENRIINELDSLVGNKIKYPGVRYSPDKFLDILNYVTIMVLCKKKVDVKKFEKFNRYNDILEFIINPSKFNYEKVKIDDYMWMNVLSIEKYLDVIKDNAKSIMNKKLKYNIENGFADEKQTRLYYKYFE